MNEFESLPDGWEFLFTPDIMSRLRDFEDRSKHQKICPRLSHVFRFLYELHFADVKVVIVGQEPYPNPRDACGYAFSVPPKQRIPPSLSTIFAELKRDIPDFVSPSDGDLEPWVKKGVLLMNASLTVEIGSCSEVSHSAMWQPFVTAIVRALSERGGIVFMLWGKRSSKLADIISPSKNLLLQASHPSPRAGTDFMGCGHFSTACKYLNDNNFWNF
jgi:uracil-DNA glycosylase